MWEEIKRSSPSPEAGPQRTVEDLQNENWEKIQARQAVNEREAAVRRDALLEHGRSITAVEDFAAFYTATRDQHDAPLKDFLEQEMLPRWIAAYHERLPKIATPKEMLEFDTAGSTLLATCPPDDACLAARMSTWNRVSLPAIAAATDMNDLYDNVLGYVMTAGSPEIDTAVDAAMKKFEQ